MCGEWNDNSEYIKSSVGIEVFFEMGVVDFCVYSAS